jgi:hypothetical protein
VTIDGTTAGTGNLTDGGRAVALPVCCASACITQPLVSALLKWPPAGVGANGFLP